MWASFTVVSCRTFQKVLIIVALKPKPSLEKCHNLVHTLTKHKLICFLYFMKTIIWGDYPAKLELTTAYILSKYGVSLVRICPYFDTFHAVPEEVAPSKKCLLQRSSYHEELAVKSQTFILLGNIKAISAIVLEWVRV